MNRVVERPRRPRELQDPLNHYLYHPLAWQLAKALAPTRITPNMVSVLGAGMVVLAGLAYAAPPPLPVWPLSALLGMALHMGWHVVDGADGDLARITGKASPIGELVDGLCDYLSHVVLYIVLGWLLHFQIGWTWAMVAMWGAGLSHVVQSNHVEVQKRSYQWWVYGVPWLKTTQEKSDQASDKASPKGPLAWLVRGYLFLAAGVTPHSAAIDRAVEQAQGDPARLEAIRTVIRSEMPPLILIWKFLGPNPRALVLGASMLAGSPLWYMIYQGVVLNALLVFSVIRHNAAWKRISARLAQGGEQG